VSARSAEPRARDRRPLVIAVLVLALAVAVVATRPASVRAEGGGALVAEPVLAATAAGVHELFGATPGEIPSEVWGVGTQPGGLDAIVRYTEGGGWEFVPEPVEEEGLPVSKIQVPNTAAAGRTTPAGGVVTAAVVGERSSTEAAAPERLLVRNPGGVFRAVRPPEGFLAEGEELFEFTESSNAPSVFLAGVEEEGSMGAFVVPHFQRAGATKPNTEVLHYNGSEWSRERICLGTASQCEMSTLPTGAKPTSKFEVVSIDASGPGSAWLLGRVGGEGSGLVAGGGRTGEMILLHRERGEWRKQALGGPLGERYKTEVSTIGGTKVFVNPWKHGQPLTVTARGVWIDVSIAVGSGEATPSDATIYVNAEEGTATDDQITGAWCNLPPSAVEIAAAYCTGELPADLPDGQARSFAWPGNGAPGQEFGTRAITGIGKGAMLIFENGAWTRVSLAGNGGTVAGAALSSPDQGWLGPSYRLTREAIPTGLVSWPVPFRRPLTAIASEPGMPVGELGSEALAVGEAGQVARYEPGIGWQPESLLTGSGSRATPNLRAVAWPVRGLAYAVGDEGAMWIWRAGSDLWEPDPGAPPNLIRGNFTGIAFDPDEPERGYAVGQQGLLLAYGRRWTQEALPPEIGSEPNITSIAFAGNEAIATWSAGVPSKNPNLVAEFVGGVIVNSGSGWRVEPQATEVLAATEGRSGQVSPRRVAGLPDGGAVIAGASGQIIEREAAGAPWHAVPGPPLGFPAALTAVQEGGQLRAIVSVEANSLASPESGPARAEEKQGGASAIAGQGPPLLIEPYPLPASGYIVRQTANGWRDEERQAYPVPPVPTDQSGTKQMDIPRTPDPVLALLVNASGSRGWAVGGQTGLMAGAPGARGTVEREGLLTSMVMRFGETAAAPANTSTVPVPVAAGEATFAVGGNAQCVDTCADLAGTGIGPNVWLEAAVGKAAATPGVRAFLYTGASVAQHVGPGINEGIDLSRISRDEFGEEEAAYAHRLGSAAGTLPVYATPAESDLYESSLSLFGQKFEASPAPLGKGTPGVGIQPTSEGDRATGNYSYSFESSGATGGERVRVIDLDYATAPIETQDQCWLAEQLAEAKAASTPAIVVGNREVGKEATLSQILVTGSDEACPQTNPGAASAYFFDSPEANRSAVVAWGTAAIPAYGTGSLGYERIPESASNQYVAASGFLLASVDTAARNSSTNVAPVSARLIPSIGSLALNALDGTLLRRSQTALFEGLARRPQAGYYCAGNDLPVTCEQVKPDPYVQIPAECGNQPSCPSEILPEYRFYSSRPDIANFVKVDPASRNPRAVFLNGEGKPVADSSSGLLCAFNSGTTTVSVETGGLIYSIPVTVQKGSVAQPCGTVPRTDLVQEIEPLETPLPPVETKPGFKPKIESIVPPPNPGVGPSPTPMVHTQHLPTPHRVPAKPPIPISLPFFAVNPLIAPVPVIVPPAPPAAAEPAPPTGTSPVTQPAVSPEPEEEEEVAFDVAHQATARQHGRRVPAAIAAYRYRAGSGSVPWPIYALPTLVVIAALSSYGIAGRRRRRGPEPAFLQPPR
jgi:hypothetical protein